LFSTLVIALRRILKVNSKFSQLITSKTYSDVEKLQENGFVGDALQLREAATIEVAFQQEKRDNVKANK
jgi:hypothetical protein